VTTIAALLCSAPSDSVRRDLEVLIAHTLDVGRAYLYAHGHDALSAASAQRIENALDRYRSGTPVAYITGTREFWSFALDVSRDVLIPRPETELLVELVLQNLAPHGRVLDLGTGSGAIALAIKQERPDCRVVATDISADAIAVARRNADRHGLEVELRTDDWYAAVAEAFDTIVSNPPYIRAADPHLDLLVGEPAVALIGGTDGLDALRIVISGAPAHLVDGGRLLVEHGFDQGESVRHLFDRAGFRRVESRRDGAGHERVTLGER
jgi:release factor glutamine methyltransferase